MVETVSFFFSYWIFIEADRSILGILGGIYAFGLLSMIGIFYWYPMGVIRTRFSYFRRPFESLSLSRFQIRLFLTWFLGLGALIIYLIVFTNVWRGWRYKRWIAQQMFREGLLIRCHASKAPQTCVLCELTIWGNENLQKKAMCHLNNLAIVSHKDQNFKW